MSEDRSSNAFGSAHRASGRSQTQVFCRTKQRCDTVCAALETDDKVKWVRRGEADRCGQGERLVSGSHETVRRYPCCLVAHLWRGSEVRALHSGKPQAEREDTLRRFRARTVPGPGEDRHTAFSSL